MLSYDIPEWKIVLNNTSFNFSHSLCEVMFNFKQYIQELRCILKDAAEKSIWNLCHKEKGFGLENRKRPGEIIHDDY